MIIKQRKWKQCPECKSRSLLSEEVYGCDNCRKPIDFDKPDKEKEYLRLTVFYHYRDETDDLEFCSWECVFERLKELKTDSFIDLPYISFEMKNPKMGIEAFWKAIRNIS